MVASTTELMKVDHDLLQEETHSMLKCTRDNNNNRAEEPQPKKEGIIIVGDSDDSAVSAPLKKATEKTAATTSLDLNASNMRLLKNKPSHLLTRLLNLFSQWDTPKQHVFLIRL